MSTQRRFVIVVLVLATSACVIERDDGRPEVPQGIVDVAEDLDPATPDAAEDPAPVDSGRPTTPEEMRECQTQLGRGGVCVSYVDPSFMCCPFGGDTCNCHVYGGHVATGWSLRDCPQVCDAAPPSREEQDEYGCWVVHDLGSCWDFYDEAEIGLPDVDVPDAPDVDVDVDVDEADVDAEASDVDLTPDADSGDATEDIGSADVSSDGGAADVVGNDETGQDAADAP